MTGLGVYHYGARFYSPKLGRFLSADSIVPGCANPQNLNRYSYVNNSPLMYTDPTGHELNETQGNGGCSTSGFCPRDYDFTPEPEEDGDGGGGGGGGGGGKPEDNPKQEGDQTDNLCSNSLLAGDWCIEKTFNPTEISTMATYLEEQGQVLFIFGIVVAIIGAGLSLTPAAGLGVALTIYGLAVGAEGQGMLSLAGNIRRDPKYTNGIDIALSRRSGNLPQVSTWNGQQVETHFVWTIGGYYYLKNSILK